jgi:PTH1 family peptidyl-tRNA hydrolase
MKLIVGLGNYPLEYVNTRHNAGFCAIDNFCYRNRIVFDKDKFEGHYTILNNSFIIAKPYTLMNLSGKFIKAIVDFYHININDILVICDDVDLNVGSFKIKESGSSNGHNGLKNINEQLRTEYYKRLKIGVGPYTRETDLATFVLGKFGEADKSILDVLVNNEITSIIEDFISDVPFDKIMSKYNKKNV